MAKSDIARPDPGHEAIPRNNELFSGEDLPVGMLKVSLQSGLAQGVNNFVDLRRVLVG